MSTPAPDLVLKDLFQNIRGRLDQLTGRVPRPRFGLSQALPARKIPIPAFLAALIALGSETVLSLERIAKVIGLAANLPLFHPGFSRAPQFQNRAF